MSALHIYEVPRDFGLKLLLFSVNDVLLVLKEVKMLFMPEHSILPKIKVLK